MRTKTNLSQTNPRPKCGAEASHVSNDVYNQRYTREKAAERSKQRGKSMIEMLGVLAIIGVLTVGSIAGYSHAMRRHLLNKQREQLSYILSAVDTHRDMLDISPNSTLPDRLKPIFETFGWVPEEMIRKNNNVYIYDVFKNSIMLYIAKGTTGGAPFMGLRIDLANDNPHEQCVNLYQMIQQYHSFLWLTEVQKINENSLYTNNYYGDKYCTDSRECMRDLTPAKISELCRVCDDENRCHLYILWK